MTFGAYAEKMHLDCDEAGEATSSAWKKAYEARPKKDGWYWVKTLWVEWQCVKVVDHRVYGPFEVPS